MLGCGLGVVYPSSNRRLYEDMRAKGLLLTEQPPHQRPTEGSFPERNRIIAALARVTVVIEAGATSGALITARVANDLSRTVMAVPGMVTSALSVGTNRLIQDGAHPLLRMEDLMARYPEVRVQVDPAVRVPADRSLEQRLLSLLERGPSALEDLCLELGEGSQSVLVALGTLEIAGLVAQRADRLYAAANRGLAAEAIAR